MVVVGGNGGSLFFNQLLHRGENTTFPLVFYGGYLKHETFEGGCIPEELSLSFLEQPFDRHDSLKLNLDLFIFPQCLSCLRYL